MIIGLTGGIGSGKSTIAKQLRTMGYAVYDTDSAAKRLIVEDVHVRKQMVKVFGKEVYINGEYQTAVVAARVFADTSLLTQLNAIVHPAVEADILRWAREIDNTTRSCTTQHAPTLCFVECAILYQAGLDRLCDKVVAVTAPEEMRLQRVVARDHSTTDKVRARIEAQREEEKKLWHADLVVNNDGKTEITAICLQIRDFFCTFAL